MKVRHLLTIKDLCREDLDEIFQLAADMKANPERYGDAMHNKNMAMIFEKSSTRTRVSFESAMARMGGHALFLSPKDTQLGRGETVSDTAQVLGRMVDVIMARVFKHEDVVTLAEKSGVPVINGLSDYAHPCQALADYLTILEHKGKFEGLRVVYVGDSNNNVTHSLMECGALLGVSVDCACPKGYHPAKEVLAWCRKVGKKTGATFEVFEDPVEAVKGADVIYSDVWVSMGVEHEKEQRLIDLHDYQVNLKLFNQAKKDAIFMHCLPAHRGEEVTDDVCDHPRSAIFDEAENRLHAQAALILCLMAAWKK